MQKTIRRDFLKTVGVAAIGSSFLMESSNRIRAQNKPNAASKSQQFAPGEKVPISGIYDVTHDKIDGEDHAGEHQITLSAGTLFPPCKACREWVRFRLYQAAEHPDATPHFAP
jgi:YjzC-like protein